MQISRHPTFHYRRTWSELSRRERKERFIRVKNEAREEADLFHGLYHTSDMMGEHCSWMDLVILSQRYKGTYYNVTLESSICAFGEAVNDLAWERAFPKPESEWGPPRSHKLDMSLFEKEQKLIVEQGLIVVHEKWAVDDSYTAGIGLLATIHEPSLTVDVVEAFVRRFLESGETSFYDPTPLSFSYEDLGNRLVFLKHHTGYDEEWKNELRTRNAILAEKKALLDATATVGIIGTADGNEDALAEAAPHLPAGVKKRL